MDTKAKDQKPIRVVCCGPMPEGCGSLSRELETAAVEVSTVSALAEVLPVISSHQPEILVLGGEVEEPGSLVWALQSVRRSPTSGHLWIVVLSPEDMPGDMRVALFEAGADEVIYPCPAAREWELRLEHWAAIVEARLQAHRFQAIFRSSQDGMVVIDGDRYVEVNEAAVKLLGRSSIAEVKSKTPWDLSPLHQADGERSADKARQLYKEAYAETLKTFEWLHEDKDGKRIDTEIALSPFLSGGKTYLMGVIRDLSHRKRLESKLRDTEGILQAAMNSSHAGIAIADAPDGKLRYVNKAGLLLGGAQPEELIDDVDISKYAERWHVCHVDGSPLEPDDIPLTRAIRYGEVCSRELLFRRPNEEVVFVRANASPIRDHSGKIVAGVVVFSDISEERRALLKLEASEKRNRLARTFSKIGMWEYNPHSGELHWTDEIFPMLGYAKEELSPSFAALENRVHPDDLEHFHTTLQNSIDERREYFVEYRVILPGNRVKWIAVHGDVVLNDTGEVINMYGAVMDIHEQKQRELKLARLTRVLRSIRDVNQLITHVKQATELVNSTVDILADNGGFSCVHFDLVDEDLNVLHHASSMTEDWGQMEAPVCPCSHHKGDQLPLDTVFTTAATATARIKHLSNPRGGEIMQLCRTIGHEAEIYGRLCVGTRPEIIPLEEEEALFNEICDDLGYALYNIQLEHRREEAYAQMQLAKNEAEQASNAKDAFLAVMNHELRTPLNPIMAYTQLLMEEAREEDTSLLKGILDASRRMLGLIEMILEFSNLNNAHTAPRKEPFNLLQACNAVFDEFRLQTGKLDYRFNNGGHGLSPLPIGLQVDGDRDMLMRILENILQNAVKYTPKGSITFIAGRYPDSRKPPHFHFVVKDTGIGIDDTSVERLFDAFQQADNSYKRSYGGLGLGLAICKKLVDLLGGNIHVESSLHQGSTFTVELPLPLSKEGGDGLPEKEASPGNLAFSKELKILIVEDEENNAAVTGTLIRHLGGQPTLAEGGLKALDLCRSNRYDAIFLDLRMPGVDGIETFKRLRDESALNALTPVVALTANVSDPMRDHCERLGMAGFVAKPISLETLYSTVQELV